MRTQFSLLAGVVALFVSNVGASPTPKCNSDNVLRALKGKSDQASAFCSTYTLSSATSGQPYPTYISKWSTESTRISSACTCLNSGNPATTSATTTPALTTTPATTSATTPVTTTRTTTIKCNGDNVLRALLGRPSDASAFCQTYTLSAATAGQSYPSYIAKYSTQATRISSACTCLVGPAPATTTTTPTTTTSSDPWHDPSPTETDTQQGYSDPTPVGTVTGVSIPIQTGTIEEGIAPAAVRSAYHGSLVGEESETVFLGVTALTAKADWPLVRLDDLLPGLTAAPQCGGSTISLTFIDSSHYDLAVDSWASQFLLVTSGDCGTPFELNFFQSSIQSSAANTIVLNIVETEIKDAISGLDTRFVHVPNPNVPQSRKRSIEERDLSDDFEDFINGIIGEVVGFVSKVIEYVNDLAKVTTAQWHIDTAFGSVVLVGDISISCWECGLSTSADIFGQAKIDFENLSETGLLLGLEFTNPSMILDLIFDIDQAIHVGKSVVFAEAPIFYAIVIPNIIEIGPLIQLVGSAELTTTSGFAWSHVGFTASWSNLDFGYNFITKQPFGGGNIIPTDFHASTGSFGTDHGVTREQEIDVDIWAGPRAKFGVTLGGTIDCSADLTFKFPAVHISASPKDAAQCGGDPATDICVTLSTSLEASLNADFEAGVLDFASSQQLPQTVYNGDFLIPFPEIIPGS
ncbi:hypothetical protein TWF696_000579 [Orbilia brochopaga]|uniref:DUF7029 domain-containing protein n=1 Tax=Orbilia brochopaga TaxID=3140254 RepID=A0AAV9VE10_9PEZI